ncbi:MAG: T9SS type A sorting domain-containing protein [Bacteroidetes bacterium]|nr:T9SS type A sorting domain-containing protein [Bacteroidota bacterium]HET6245244.1 PHB depolymerase family esterase [Bacteroidia bacterium]
MRISILLTLLLSSLTIQGQTFIKSFTFDGVVRSYRIFIPSNYDPLNEYPLVFNLHGNGSSASQQEPYSQMNLIADTANFIVVYPDGISNTWNSGFNVPYNSGTNDVGFISALIDTVSANYTINSQRVYSCGMSMGGFMSYRLACELNGRIAAIASVTGLMSVQLPQNCQQQKEVPVLQIHGTDDATVLYNGTSWHTSVNATVDFWIQKNNCPTTAIVTNMPDIVNEGSTVVKYYYGPCTNNSEVVLFKVEGGGHTWPGDIAVPSLGNTNQDIKASIEIWKFFSRHELALPTSVIHTKLSKGNSIIIAPNPVNDKLNLSFSETEQEKIISVFNSKAVLVHTQTVAPSISSTAIDLTTFPTGLYLVVINNGESKEVVKVVKK